MKIKNTTDKPVVLVESNSSMLFLFVHRLQPGQVVQIRTDRVSNVIVEIQPDVGQQTRPKEGWVETTWGMRPYGWDARKETEHRGL